MAHRIIRNIPRADPEVVKALGQQGVSTVHEAQGGTGLMRTYMRPIYPGARVAGSAVTVFCSGDNLMIHAAIEVCRPGDVLVVVSASETTDGMFGDLLGSSCRARGVVGLVIDAGVRDVTELTEMAFPVWAKAICAHGTLKATGGSVNVEVACAGVTVQPGDVVVADQDGVVVVRRQEAAEVARLSQVRADRESVIRERLRAGELSVDVFNLRGKLAERGVEYLDETAE